MLAQMELLVILAHQELARPLAVPVIPAQQALLELLVIRVHLELVLRQARRVIRVQQATPVMLARLPMLLMRRQINHIELVCLMLWARVLKTVHLF
jgi:hypothetical protein